MSKQLVFTVALKREIPCDWLKASNVEIATLKTLSSGGFKGAGDKSVLFIISGVGLHASRKTAMWIKENLNPLFVVNIGSAGGVKGVTIGDWIMPLTVRNEEGGRLNLKDWLPFPLPESINIHRGGELLSVKRPKLGNIPSLWRRFNCIDMECYAQADVFKDTDISFHSLKWISDVSGSNAISQFLRSLPYLRDEIKSILNFLKRREEPDISVIIPVYNREKGIAECVASVLRQSLPPREVIVVNDGSTDGTMKLLESFNEKIRIISLPQNRGVSAARNAGIKASKGKWLSFLDSDDMWKDDKLYRQWKFLNTHPFYEAIQSEELWIRNGRRVNPCKHHKKPEGWIWKKSLERCLVSPSAVMVKRDLFEKNGMFDEGLPACEDYDMWLRIGRETVFGLDPGFCVIKHGGHEDQLSKRYPTMDAFRINALLKALKREYLPEYRMDIIRILQKKLSILIQGSRKRMMFDRAEKYEAIYNSIRKEVQV